MADSTKDLLGETHARLEHAKRVFDSVDEEGKGQLRQRHLAALAVRASSRI